MVTSGQTPASGETEKILTSASNGQQYINILFQQSSTTGITLPRASMFFIHKEISRISLRLEFVANLISFCIGTLMWLPNIEDSLLSTFKKWNHCTTLFHSLQYRQRNLLLFLNILLHSLCICLTKTLLTFQDSRFWPGMSAGEAVALMQG